MNTLLSDAKPHIEQTLVRMLSKPEHDHPFIIIEDSADDRIFVQFCGSRQKILTFDVPRKKLTIELSDIGNAADLAINTLREFGCVERTRLLITESKTVMN